MQRKIIFLDIDGVLQPASSQERFEHICYNDFENSDMPELYKHLKYKFNIDYSIYNQYDVAAVFWDWDKSSVDLLKLTLSLTGAKIVLSSDWRRDGFDRMKDFFTIYGLEKYFIDCTAEYDKMDKSFIEKTKAKFEEENGKDAYIDERSIEILEWLSKNPDVKRWVAIDDRKLRGLGDHFVWTEYRYTAGNAEKCIRLLTDCFEITE